MQIRAQEVAVNLSTGKKNKVPIELEKGDLPINTFNNKKPFKGKIVSVERIVGPKATGETCHIVVETNGDIPYWEGQSYGVIPPVLLSAQPASCLRLLQLALCVDYSEASISSLQFFLHSIVCHSTSRGFRAQVCM